MAQVSVKLIAITQPLVEGPEHPLDAFEFIAYCARVSNPANQMNTETSGKLLKYLISHKHWSPFEMVSLSFEITTTRDISRQMIRHRSMFFQEHSQRYAEAPGFVKREARLQDPKNRQNSFPIPTTEQEKEEWFQWAQDFTIGHSTAIYKDALAMGIAKEQARALLPEGLTETTLIMSGTLRSFIHYCEVRMDSSTQKEHRIIAEQVWSVLQERFKFLKEDQTP